MIEVIQDPAGMEGLRSSWNELAQHASTPLLRFEWFAAAAHALCPPARLMVVVVRKAGEIRGIAPLVLQPGVELGCLQLLGSRLLGEQGGLLWKHPEDLEDLLSGVLSLGRPAQIGRIPEDTPLVSTIRGLRAGKAWVALSSANPSAWIPIMSSWEEYLASCSSSARHRYRRQWRRAEKRGRVELSIETPDSTNIESKLREAYRIEALGWKGRAGSAILSREWSRRFFTHLGRSLAELGILRLCFLRIDGNVAATQIAAVDADRWCQLKIGYDESWSRYSPGTMLVHATIRRSFESSLKTYEFLGKAEPWMSQWPHLERALVSPRMYPRNTRGLAALGVDATTFVHHRLRGLFRRNKDGAGNRRAMKASGHPRLVMEPPILP